MVEHREHRARGKARRDALLRAAVDVVAERGAAGVTHRAVTEQAGMPLATASYFFSSIDELAAEALRTFAGERVALLQALAEELAAEQRAPEDVAAAFAQAALGQGHWTAAQFEAYLHAGRTPEFRAVVADTLASFRQVVVSALAAAGVTEADTVAPAFVALADGFALHHLALPGELDTDALRRAFRRLLIGYLVDIGQADQAMRLARESS